MNFYSDPPEDLPFDAGQLVLLHRNNFQGFCSPSVCLPATAETGRARIVWYRGAGNAVRTTRLPINLLCFAPGYPTLRRLRLLILAVGLVACGRTQPPGAGPQQRMRLTVGEIKEISLPSPTDTTVALAGSSDNSEVVDVSPKQTAGAAQPTTPGTQTFLIKGVTIGTARVIFSEKRTGTASDGPARKTYLVQVVSQ